MLIFVPILAGLWPTVKIGINRYNQAITESTNSLESATAKLEFVSSSLNEAAKFHKEIKNIVDDLKINLNRIIEDYSLKTIEDDNLPKVWALGFFAALFVTIGHFLYQLLSPELIKRSTSLEFVNEALRSWVDHSSKSQMQRAKYFVEKYNLPESYDIGNTPRESSPFLEKLLTTLPKTKYGGDAELSQSDIDKKRQEFALIEKGAAINYFVEAKRKKFGAIVSGVFYLFGLLLVFYIIVEQSYRVIIASWGG